MQSKVVELAHYIGFDLIQDMNLSHTEKHLHLIITLLECLWVFPSASFISQISLEGGGNVI